MITQFLWARSTASEGWNYFDRLWPLWEWAVRGPKKVRTELVDSMGCHHGLH